MTYELVDLIAENEARLAFIGAVLSGKTLDEARKVRETVFRASRRAICLRCKLEKHVDEFYGRNDARVQSYCKSCMKEYVTRYNSH